MNYQTVAKDVFENQKQFLRLSIKAFRGLQSVYKLLRAYLYNLEHY